MFGKMKQDLQKLFEDLKQQGFLQGMSVSSHLLRVQLLKYQPDRKF